MEIVRPIPDSYWVDFAELTFPQPVEGRLLAGEYPGAKDQVMARKKVQALLDAGVTLFLDLTQPGEYNLVPYYPVVAELSGGRVKHKRMPIRDMDVPSPGRMRLIQQALDEALDAGETVYVHCYGGIGRTGTVVGCFLAGHGMNPTLAIQAIAGWRKGTPDGHRESPETEAQRRMILEWEG